MALVAYSDESDISDCEDYEQSTGDFLPIFKKKSFTDNITSTINDIDDEDNIEVDDGIPRSSQHIRKLLSTVPSVKPAQKSQVSLDNEEDNDLVDDVPTLESWNVIKEIQNSSQAQSLPVKISVRKDKRNKLKFILPSLTEFDDDSDEEQMDEPKKKLKASSSGSGLFALLPKPKGVTSLVPLNVSRKFKPVAVIKKKSSVLNPAPKSRIEDSDDDDDIVSAKDFFSFSDDARVPPILPTLELPVIKSTSVENDIPVSVPPINVVSNVECETESVEFDNLIKPLPLHDPVDIEPPSCSARITSSIPDEDALLKLTGRRNRGEIINLIDVCADDNLMSKHEWMTRALSEVKPTKSFSKKRDGMPTSQQKRKHHITYLAHQAQEREHELSNSWGQNRHTKMQTQSRYGF